MFSTLLSSFRGCLSCWVVLFLSLTWTQAADDVHPVGHATLAGNAFQLTISNLTVQTTNEIQGRDSLSSGNWERVDSFVATEPTYVWQTTLTASSTSRFYRIVSLLPEDPYELYFLRNPTVAQLTVNRFDEETRQSFDTALASLEQTGQMTVPEPVALRDCQEPQSCQNIFLTEQEFKQILGSKAAHAVWLDKEGRVPWRLRDYSLDDLRMLLHEDFLFNGSGTSRYFYSVVDHSPSEVYLYALDRGLLQSNQLASVYAAMTDFRSDFRHSNTSDTNRNTAYSVLKALSTYTAFEQRVSRAGCHSMTRIALAVLRSLNIPGEETRAGQWFPNGHSTAVWPCVERVLAHGDNIYSALLRATPVEAFLTPDSFYEEQSGSEPCQTDPSCLSRRHMALNALAWPSSYTTDRCCRPTQYGYESCLAFLEANLGPFLTAEELRAGADDLERQCP